MTSEPIPFKLSKKTQFMSNSATSHMVTDKREVNEELIKFHEVEGTPFTVAEEAKEGYKEYHVLLGNKRFDTYESLEEAMKEAKEITWNKIFTVIGVAFEKLTENLK